MWKLHESKEHACKLQDFFQEEIMASELGTKMRKLTAKMTEKIEQMKAEDLQN
ncbi:hypothetical protein E2542_SST02010 [Spatholobus suberectus]|nr:hypothetical protein E2542_SST02010 [Spatholobus suberectus]